MGINWGDILYTLFAILSVILSIAIPIVIIIFVTRIVRRSEQRAQERLQIDKENTAIQQQQNQAIEDLNKRLTHIEKLLKEVE